MPRTTVLACAFIAIACVPNAQVAPEVAAEPAPEPFVDTVSLELDFRSHMGQGYARFTQHTDHLEIDVIVDGAVPGLADLCVHEYGDCSDRDFMRAGVHYDREGTDVDEHGHHAGDIGVLRVASDGRGELRVQKYDLTIDEVLGRAVVLHAEASDGHAHGAHGAGYRAACGTIDPGEASRLAEVERELMDLRHYVQRLGWTMASNEGR